MRRTELGVSVAEGALVRQVQLDSPATPAGPRTGDVYAALRQAEPVDTAMVEVNRAGETVRIEVTVGTLGDG